MAGEALFCKSDHPTSDLALAHLGSWPGCRGGRVRVYMQACCTVVGVGGVVCGVVWCGWAEGV